MSEKEINDSITIQTFVTLLTRQLPQRPSMASNCRHSQIFLSIKDMVLDRVVIRAWWRQPWPSQNLITSKKAGSLNPLCQVNAVFPINEAKVISHFVPDGICSFPLRREGAYPCLVRSDPVIVLPSAGAGEMQFVSLGRGWTPPVEFITQTSEPAVSPAPAPAPALRGICHPCQGTSSSHSGMFFRRPRRQIQST